MIVLVLGGARSGKSQVAEALVADRATVLAHGAAGGPSAPVTVLATAAVADDDMAARVAAHQARRPPEWTTVETGPDLAAALTTTEGVALVDALGTWVAAAPDLVVDTVGLCAALSQRTADTVVVSEEVGLGVHPSSAAGRRFRDVLGLVNQEVAAIADQVLLVVAGRVLALAPATPSLLPDPDEGRVG